MVTVQFLPNSDIFPHQTLAEPCRGTTAKVNYPTPYARPTSYNHLRHHQPLKASRFVHSTPTYFRPSITTLTVEQHTTSSTAFHRTAPSRMQALRPRFFSNVSIQPSRAVYRPRLLEKKAFTQLTLANTMASTNAPLREWLVICPDVQGAFEKRLAVRSEHLKGLSADPETFWLLGGASSCHYGLSFPSPFSRVLIVSAWAWC